jgi:serine phosphatase RsbU (regulator of sigma subunit)/anti-sigma regulatory factor (Ser/Thr protein kinase)
MKNGGMGRSGLQLRMTISFVGVSVVTALLLELLVATIFLILILNSSQVDQSTMNTAKHSAQLYALEAAVQAHNIALDPRSTFQPGKPSSLALPGANASELVPYIQTRPSTNQAEAFALLIAPGGQILASSYPEGYPVSMSAGRLVPKQEQLIRNALTGRAGSSAEITAQGHAVSVVQPVWSREKSVLGAIYVQVPQVAVSGNVFTFAAGWFGTALIWLIITAPVGAFFGMLTTRGLIQRLHRLVYATAQFANGDYSQQVPVAKQDEIGQLESQFNRMALQLVESIAEQKVLVEQQARLEERAHIEQEMRTAQLIQRSLLPKELPKLPGWQIATYYQPAREVGGDLYDFLTFDDGRLGLVIGDVADKGMPAALVMACTRSMLRAAAQVTDSPGKVLARVNDLLYADIPPKMFVTCLFAVLDPRSGKLRFANAGHDLPYRSRVNGVHELYATGMPLGLMPEMSYEEHEVTIDPGENILFYSDGLVEAHNPRREMFGFPQLQALLTKDSGKESLIDFLLRELKSFTGIGWEQEDDMTLLTLQRIPVALSQSGPRKEPVDLHLLREWTIASIPGNERQVIEQLDAVLGPYHLAADRLANLKTAVAEAVMNAMEHGNHYQPEALVTLQVLTSGTSIAVRIRDQGGEQALPLTVAAPDLAAKLDGKLPARGWGLFLIEKLVDELHISRGDHHLLIELLMHQQQSSSEPEQKNAASTN